MMNTRLAILLIVLAFVAGVAVGVIGVLWATGGNSTPSQDISQVAPTLSLNNEATEPISEPQATPEATAQTATDTTTATSAEQALFRINPEQSQARFLIDEVLAGSPITVVGATNQVAGDIIVNFANPSLSQVGTIVINARTLATDNEFRNQAIRGRILLSSQDAYEFIRFVPTQLVGLPQSALAVGETVNFQIVGDLTVRDTTRSVTFEASVTLDDEGQISGSANATILYADFGIGIQAPPQVTDIGDQVGLEIDFVALAVSGE